MAENLDRDSVSDNESIEGCNDLKNMNLESSKPLVEKDLEQALQAKESGNNYFRSKSYDESIQQYSLAISYCPENEIEHLSTFYGNRAAAYFSVNEFDQTILDCNESLGLKPGYVKVLSRRMQAYEKKGNTEEAVKGVMFVLHT